MKEEKVSKLYLVRHGETDWNAAGRIQGSIDRPLNEIGLAQARVAGRDLAHLKPAAIYSSPLLRAMQTAQVINAFHSCQIHLEGRLKEASYGALIEGITRLEFRARYQAEIDEKLKLPLAQQRKHKLEADAESCEEILERSLLALCQIAGKHVGEEVIVVSHGFVLSAILSHFLSVSEEHVKVPNCCVVLLEGDESSLQLVQHTGAVSEDAR